jgi:hypothetical protein
MRPSIPSLIRASRPLSNHFSKKLSSKEEEFAFVKVFDKIMRRSEQEGASNENKAMQLVLEESLESLGKSKPRKSLFHSDIATNSTVAKPVNLFGKFHFNRDVSVKILDDFEKKNKLEDALFEVFEEMKQLENDHKLIAYLTKVISDFDKVLSNNAFKTSKFSDELITKISNDPKRSLNELTFPLIIMKGLLILAEDFNSKQEALNVIQYLKNQNLKVYFFGLTTDILNLELNIQWELYGDLNKVNSIIEELKINGIESNISTLQTLRKISGDYHQTIDPKYHLFDEENFNSVYNKQDELELYQIDQYVSDLVQMHQ